VWYFLAVLYNSLLMHRFEGLNSSWCFCVIHHWCMSSKDWTHAFNGFCVTRLGVSMGFAINAWVRGPNSCFRWFMCDPSRRFCVIRRECMRLKDWTHAFDGFCVIHLGGLVCFAINAWVRRTELMLYDGFCMIHLGVSVEFVVNA